MSFVDHYAALRLLERRAVYLPADEMIKLSLVAVKHPKAYYSTWEQMEKVIHKTCQDFRSTTTTPNPVEGQDIINRLKGLIQESLNQAPAIVSFQVLLKQHATAQDTLRHFPASIHCESSLATILCQIHDAPNASNLSLRELFQACSSSHHLPSLADF